MIDRIQGLDIHKTYNATFALQCSLEIERGPLYTVVGPNGSGKSTLLRILSLNEKPDSGTVVYHENGGAGVHTSGEIGVRRRAVLVTTKSNLFNNSVYNNIAYGLRLRGMNKNEIRDRVMTAVQDVGLEGKEQMHAAGLSSGQAQRLALARAFAIDPDVLFLDEPTASLDPEKTRIIEDIICAWRHKAGKMAVMVTHSLPQARALSDFVIFMYNGKIAEVSRSQEFFEKPSTDAGQKFVFGEVY